MKTLRLAAALAVMASGLVLAGATPAGSAQLPQGSHEPSQSVPACLEEDSPGPCFWDAQSRGNHRGRSFYVGADGSVTYVVHPANSIRFTDEHVDTSRVELIHN